MSVHGRVKRISGGRLSAGVIGTVSDLVHNRRRRKPRRHIERHCVVGHRSDRAPRSRRCRLPVGRRASFDHTELDRLVCSVLTDCGDSGRRDAADERPLSGTHPGDVAPVAPGISSTALGPHCGATDCVQSGLSLAVIECPEPSPSDAPSAWRARRTLEHQTGRVGLQLIPETAIEERQLWTLAVNRDQNLLGRSMIGLRRDCAAVVDVQDHEWANLKHELRRLMGEIAPQSSSPSIG